MALTIKNITLTVLILVFTFIPSLVSAQTYDFYNMNDRYYGLNSLFSDYANGMRYNYGLGTEYGLGYGAGFGSLNGYNMYGYGTSGLSQNVPRGYGNSLIPGGYVYIPGFGTVSGGKNAMVSPYFGYGY